LPRRPGRTPRPPPRRRGGELAAEPRPSFSRVHEHYKYPSKPSLSLFHFFPTPTHRNTFAAPSISAAAPARTRSHPSATARPKSNPPAPSACFTGPPRPDFLRCSSPERRLRRSSPSPTRLLSSRSRYSPPQPRFWASTGAHGPCEPPQPLHPCRSPDLAGQPRAPSLTTARDLGLKGAKTRGVICIARDSCE
jgi:hypothetical protein